MPLSPGALVNVSVPPVSPGMSLKVMPSLETCHCLLVAPVADAVNDTVAPLHTVCDAGLPVTGGPLHGLTVMETVAVFDPK